MMPTLVQTGPAQKVRMKQKQLVYHFIKHVSAVLILPNYFFSVK